MNRILSLSVWTALLLGLTANGHLTFVGAQLGRRGVTLRRNITITDDAEAIVAQFRESWARADVVITTGGLGPTCDDRTRECIAEVLGQKLVRWAESVLARIPVVKNIYSSVKQVSDTLLAPGGQAFRKPLLVRYPHQDCWTIAFLTGAPGPAVAKHLAEEHVSVYVPTTPNPTSGFFLMLPKKDTIELEMSVDEALTYVISMGVVTPAEKPANPL
jgi:hypothetical protein